MPKFKATVRFMDLIGPDMLAARKALEDRLRAADVGAWRLVEITEATAGRTGRLAEMRRYVDRDVAGKLILVGVAMWALWFFWALAE